MASESRQPVRQPERRVNGGNFLRERVGLLKWKKGWALLGPIGGGVMPKSGLALARAGVHSRVH